MFDFIEIKTIYTILHLFGIAIGAGGAFASDLIFFKSVKDGKLSSTEFGFMEMGSKMVWIGLAVLVVSGVLLFSLDTDKYLASSKFLAKITIVAIIIANGILLHLKFISKFRKAVREGEMPIGEYIESNPLLLVSGVVSVVSWSSAIILGAFRGIPYSYWMILDVYAAVVLSGIAFVLLFRRKLV
ncbi:MAG TPA: hypothetical protein VJC15_03565 [Candidatus Paceibacterota bacterium]